MSDLFSLEGRTAVVTGGSRGIGLAIATAFLDAGARVLVCARREGELAATVAELGAHGEVDGVRADLSTVAGVEDFVGEVTARVDALDVLVNNAGATWGAAIESFPEDGWDKVMDLNVKALHYVTAGLLPLLRAAASAERAARVINIGSIDGLTAPMMDNYAYSASKAALAQLTRHYARRLAPEHILVNTIAPGLFASKMSSFIIDTPEVAALAMETIPVRRIGRPEEIGGTAVWLASRAGGYTTGATIVVDGGSLGAGRA
ncbi:SDR family oxidoreductase [Nocardioides sp. MH1]|uniref:SDR family oxidoreductase n=1 Tax=Nocardioides sp. MH1 TaxID=3242490 RepID=UPI003521B31E